MAFQDLLSHLLIFLPHHPQPIGYCLFWMGRNEYIGIINFFLQVKKMAKLDCRPYLMCVIHQKLGLWTLQSLFFFCYGTADYNANTELTINLERWECHISVLLKNESRAEIFQVMSFLAMLSRTVPFKEGKQDWAKGCIHKCGPNWCHREIWSTEKLWMVVWNSDIRSGQSLDVSLSEGGGGGSRWWDMRQRAISREGSVVGSRWHLGSKRNHSIHYGRKSRTVCWGPRVLGSVLLRSCPKW